MYKVGDKVFDAQFGWGEVTYTIKDSYPIGVNFVDYCEIVNYKSDGKYGEDDLIPSLSFTEYDFINGGFSQERPKENVTEEHIGKLVKIISGFYKEFIGKLEKISKENTYKVNGISVEEVELYEER